MDMPVVWIIGPDFDTQRLIELNLSKRGIRVVKAFPESDLAFPAVDPQLIILDIDLPDKSGWATVSALRQHPRLQGVPLILILAYAPATSRLVPLRPVRWVEKPVAVGALLTLVRESLTRQEQNVKRKESINGDTPVSIRNA
jgi:DNA-binding response OmpR family regulator